VVVDPRRTETAALAGETVAAADTAAAITEAAAAAEVDERQGALI